MFESKLGMGVQFFCCGGLGHLGFSCCNLLSQKHSEQRGGRSVAVAAKFFVAPVQLLTNELPPA